MLAIRMQRTGRKGHAQFRVIVQESRLTPTSGKVVFALGSYNPHTKAVILNKEKAAYYLEHGAQPSPRVARLLKSEGVKLPDWVKLPENKERTVRNAEKRRSTAPEQPAEEAPAEATEAPVEDAPVEETPTEETPVETPEEAKADEELAEKIAEVEVLEEGAAAVVEEEAKEIVAEAETEAKVEEKAEEAAEPETEKTEEKPAEESSEDDAKA